MQVASGVPTPGAISWPSPRRGSQSHHRIGDRELCGKGPPGLRRGGDPLGDLAPWLMASGMMAVQRSSPSRHLIQGLPRLTLPHLLPLLPHTRWKMLTATENLPAKSPPVFVPSRRPLPPSRIVMQTATPAAKEQDAARQFSLRHHWAPVDCFFRMRTEQIRPLLSDRRSGRLRHMCRRSSCHSPDGRRRVRRIGRVRRGWWLKEYMPALRLQCVISGSFPPLFHPPFMHRQPAPRSLSSGGL